MAQIPIQTLPTQQLDSGGFTPAQAANVEPMKDFGSQQIDEFGKAQLNAGATVTKIADRIQGEMDDAEATKLFIDFSNKASKVEDEFSLLSGENAVQQSKSAIESLAKFRQEVLGAASNDVVRAIVGNKASVFGASVERNIGKHTAGQFKIYTTGQKVAEVEAFAQRAAKSYLDTEEFGKYLGAAEAKVRELGEFNGWSKEETDGKILDAKSGIHSAVAMQLSNEGKYDKAQEWIQDKFNAGELSVEKYNALSKSINDMVSDEAAYQTGISVASGGGAVASDANSVIDFVMAREGGMNPADGNGGSNFGITRETYKQFGGDGDIESLTPEQAKSFYRNMWSKYKVGDAPENMRGIYFDAIVNHGHGKAKELLLKAGGDPSKFIDLRKKEYERLAKSNSSKYGKHLKGWLARLEHNKTAFLIQPVELDKYGNVPYEQGISNIKDTITDPKQQRKAIAEFDKEYKQRKEIATITHTENVDKAMKIRGTDPSGWKKVPAELRAAINQFNPEDWAAIVQGANRATEPDISELIALKDKKTFDLEWLQENRSRMSEAVYMQQVKLASDPKAGVVIREATLDKTIVQNVLQTSNLPKLAVPEKEEQKRRRNSLDAAILREIDARQQIKNDKLSLQEKEQVVRDVLNNTIVYNGETRWVWDLTPEQLAEASVPLMSKGVLTGESVRLSDIPKEKRARYEAFLRQRNEPVTEKNIVQLHVTSIKNRK